MPTFEEPNEKMESAFKYARALDCHAKRLAAVKIKVLAKYATRDKDDEPRGEALLVGGRPALGIIRIITHEERVAGALDSDNKEDVRIILNGDRWGSLSRDNQRAVLDRCLTQIEVLVEDGRPKLDDCGRPKLRKRAFDFVVDGFHEVAERHGKSSVEVQQMRVLMSDKGQLYMHWLVDDGDVTADIAALAPRPKPEPKATKAVVADTTRKRGKLGERRLRERIECLDRPETILGLAKLELQEAKPRDGVMAALNRKVKDMLILPDFIAITKSEATERTPDIAAAVLVTTPGCPSEGALEQLVAECQDPVVLGWLVDEERERSDEARDHVIDVITTRLADIGGGGSTWTP